MGQRNSSMPIHPPGHHSEGSSPFQRAPSRSAIRRQGSLESFTMHEENELSAASAMMYSAAINSQAPANTNRLVGENWGPPHYPSIQRTSSARSYPFSLDQPAPKRQITSWPSYVPNPSSGLNQQPAWSYPPHTVYNAANVYNRALLDPTNPAMWNIGSLARRAETPYQPLSPFDPSGYSSSLPYRNATPNPLLHHLSVGIPNEPVLSQPLQDPLSNGPQSPPSTSLSSDAVESALVNEPIHSSARVPPLPLVSANFILSSDALDLELLGSRSNMPWANWELQFILSELLGPGAQIHFILTLLREPRRTTNESELNPVWQQLSARTFRGARTVAAVLTRWGLLVDTCKAILYFAENSGLDLCSPEFQDVELFVSQVIAMWRRHVPEGESWGTDLKLKPADVAAWTHDPKNGWLAMMYRRLRESNVPLPTMELPDLLANSCRPSSNPQRLKRGRHTQSLSEGCSPLSPPSMLRAATPRRPALRRPALQRPAPQHCASTTVSGFDPGSCLLSSSAQSSIPPGDQIAENDGLYPVPEGYSRGWEMLREQHVISCASTSVAAAKARWIRTQAIETHAGVLDRILERVENARDKRLNLALQYLQNAPASPIRSQIDTWFYENFFTKRPLDEALEVIDRLEEHIGLAAAANTKPDEAQMDFSPPLPQLKLPN